MQANMALRLNGTCGTAVLVNWANIAYVMPRQEGRPGTLVVIKSMMETRDVNGVEGFPDFVEVKESVETISRLIETAGLSVAGEWHSEERKSVSDAEVIPSLVWCLRGGVLVRDFQIREGSYVWCSRRDKNGTERITRAFTVQYVDGDEAVTSDDKRYPLDRCAVGATAAQALMIREIKAEHGDICDDCDECDGKCNDDKSGRLPIPESQLANVEGRVPERQG